MNEAMTSVQGLSQLLRAVAGRMEGSVDGLNKELLLQSAEQLDKLETVADVAEMVIDRVPRVKASRIRESVLVRHATLVSLADALEATGRPIKRANV